MSFQRGNQINRGRKNSKAQNDKISNANKGKERTVIAKEHYSSAAKIRQKKLWENPEYRERQLKVINKIAGWNAGLTAEKDARILSGKNHPGCGNKSHFWKGGVSFLPYCYKFNKELKKHVRERDNHTCQLCSMKENGNALDVHHVHYDKPNCNPDLISLCRKCNIIVNFKRDYWEDFFMKKLKERGLVE